MDREVKIFVGQGWKSSSELPDQQKLLHCLHYEVQKRQNKLGEHKPIIVVCRLGIFLVTNLLSMLFSCVAIKNDIALCKTHAHKSKYMIFSQFKFSSDFH